MNKFKKILKWTIYIVLILLVVSIAGLWLFFPVEKAKEIAIEKGSAALGRDISIETAKISFWGGIGIKLTNVAISNPEGFEKANLLTAENIDIKLRMIPLIMGDVVIDRLILNSPKIEMVKLSDSLNNFTFTKLEEQAPKDIAESTPAEIKATAAAVSFDDFEINKGSLVYDDRTSNTVLDINGLSLHSRMSLENETKYNAVGDITIDSLQYKNNLTLPLVSVEVEYNFLFDYADKSLRIEESHARINQFPFVVSGNLKDVFENVSAAVNIKSDNAKITELLSFVPESKKEVVADFKISGDIAYDFDIEYNLSGDSSLNYFGTSILSGLSVLHTNVPGELTCQKVLLDFKNDNLRFNIEEGKFDGKPIKAHVIVDDFEHPVVNASFTGSLNLKYLEPFLPEGAHHTIAGETDFDIKVSGQTEKYEDMKFSGNLQAKSASYNSDFMLEPVDTLNLDLYFDNNIVSVKKLDATSKSGRISFHGRVNSFIQYLLSDSTDINLPNPTFDGNLSGDINLTMLKDILPEKGNPELEGDLSLDLAMTGEFKDLSKLAPYGTMTITNGKYRDSLLPEPINNFDASFNVITDTIIVNSMAVKFESSDASFTGKLIRPFPYLLPIKDFDRSDMKKPYFIFDLKSNRFDSDKLFPEAVPGSAESMGTKDPDSISLVILPDIEGRGNFTIDTLIYSEVELTEITGKVKIYDRKIECYSVTGRAYTGYVSGKTTIDLNDFNKPVYTGEFKAIEIEANGFATQFSKFDDMIFGKIDIEGSYTAEGWEPDEFLNSLKMNSVSHMNDGKVALSGEIFSESNKLIQSFGQDLNKEQIFRNFWSSIKMENGKVSFDKLQSTMGDIGDLELDGFYHINGDINYVGKVLLTKEMTAKALSKIKGITSILSNENAIDRVALPVKITGTVEKPSLSIDISGIAKDAGKNLLEDIGNSLFKKK